MRLGQALKIARIVPFGLARSRLRGARQLWDSIRSLVPFRRRSRLG